MIEVDNVILICAAVPLRGGEYRTRTWIPPAEPRLALRYGAAHVRRAKCPHSQRRRLASVNAGRTPSCPHNVGKDGKETELTQPWRQYESVITNCVSGTRKWWAPADLPPPRAASPARRAQLRANSSRSPSHAARGAHGQPATTCRHHASAPAPAPSATEATASASAHVMQPPQRIRRSERAKVADDDDSTCDCFDILLGNFVKNEG